jgi:hypothetical protein
MRTGKGAGFVEAPESSVGPLGSWTSRFVPAEICRSTRGFETMSDIKTVDRKIEEQNPSYTNRQQIEMKTRRK